MRHEWKSSPVIHKLAEPVLTYRDIPYPATLVFNAGVAKYQGKYVMVFRNDAGTWGKPGFKTTVGVALSDDGIHFTPKPTPFMTDIKDDEILSVYDPRVTVIDGVAYICLAMNTWHGLRGVIVKTIDFEKYEVVTMTAPDNRNMVLFPERVGGNFVRLERPMPVYSRNRIDRFDVWLSESPDMVYWGKTRLVLGKEHVPFSNDKLGPAAPPIKTRAGWLCTFHAVEKDPTVGKNGWEAKWDKRYYGGVMLLDLDDPSRVIGMSKEPLIVTDQPFERGGFRDDVIFPGAMILEESGEVKIYYGAADTVECLAYAHVDDLIALCDKPIDYDAEQKPFMYL